MDRPVITLACSLYDRMLPLYLGEATVEGFEARFEPARSIMDIRCIFDNVASNGAYDVAEMSIAEYLTSLLAQASDYVGLPVFASRAFRSSSIFVRIDRISRPQDLSGSRIGVPLYGMTAAVFRGFLFRRV
jgi:4,5-dihydroxyphthalate decarboxylase